MNRKALQLFCIVVVFATVMLCAGRGVASDASTLIGKEITNFSLSSNQNRLVTYGDDYYGQHHLIITFFPAAFTPV